MRLVVSYTRVSTKEQGEGFSLDVQERVLDDFARAHELRIVRPFSESHSAFRPGERPQFNEMLRFLQQRPDVTGVLVYKLDRLGRNMPDFARLSEMQSLEVISATEHLPPGSTGELLSVVTQGVSRFFSAQLSERVTSAMAEKASKGLWPSYAPTGYVNIEDPPCIEPDPERAPLVRELFELAARSHMSLRGLSQWAEEHGLRTRQGGALRKSAIHKLLRNPTYYGVIEWKGRRYEGQHEPLISESLFSRVQEAFQEKTHTVTKRSFAYRGLLVCGYCGCQITASYAKKGRYIYYRCTHGRGECEQPYVREDRLGERLFPVIQSLHMSGRQVTELLTLMHDRREERLRLREEKRKHLLSKLDGIGRRRDQSYVDKLDGRIGEERWLKMDRRFANEEFQVKCELETLGAEQEPSVDDIKATLELLHRGPELYRRQSECQRARLLRLLVWNCGLRGEDVDPVYRKPFDLIAQGVRSANWYPQEDSNRVPSDGGSGS